MGWIGMSNDWRNPAWADHDYRWRLVTFRIKHPELAKLVHRLQLLDPTMSVGSRSPVWDDDQIRRILGQDMKCTKEQISTIFDILIGSLEKLKRAQIHALTTQERLNGKSSSMVSTSIRNTFRSLPNLYHVEHSLSNQDRITLGALEYKILDKTGVRVDRNRLMILSWESSFEIAPDLIVPYLNLSITSLKLRRVVLSDYPSDREISLPQTLQHLDLELWDHHDDPDLDDDYNMDDLREEAMTFWRSHLATLQQLTRLRLSWADIRFFPIYIDDLLIDPEESTKITFFPHLQSLSMTHCSLRPSGLLAFAKLHASTLQELELSHVTFDPSYCPESWSEIGALCKSVLPRLAYLWLSKLVTHFPERADAPLDALPIQERWNPGVEATTAYEWRKGVCGPDGEIKGPRCPWEAKDVLVTEDCKQKFNGDRYRYSADNQRRLHLWGASFVEHRANGAVKAPAWKDGEDQHANCVIHICDSQNRQDQTVLTMKLLLAFLLS